jgi:hypothetical protein
MDGITNFISGSFLVAWIVFYGNFVNIFTILITTNRKKLKNKIK